MAAEGETVVDYEPEEDEVLETKITRGRGGHGAAMDQEFDKLETDDGPGPVKYMPVEGWIVFVTGVHAEAQEEDIHELFADYGEIMNMHLNLDRRTGFVKGYAMVEYKAKAEAQRALQALNGTTFMEQTIQVSWSFNRGPMKVSHKGRRSSPPSASKRPSRR